MAHASGNPTWADWPSTTTQVTATTLENEENAIDRLTTEMFGAPGRTAPYRCTVVYTASFGISGSDVFASAPGNWAAFSDPDGLFNNTSSGGGAVNFARIAIPVTGYWILEGLTVGATTANTQAVATISAGTGTTVPTVAANGVVMDQRSFVGATNITLNPHIRAHLTAGMYVYWSNWASASNTWTLWGTLPNTPFRTQITVKWDGLT
jgi:hypothetical protein